MSTTFMLNKIITCEVKEVAPRVLEFIGSTESKDRQTDIIKASGWVLDNYNKNPVFMWAHDYSQPPIGKAVKVWIQDKKLMFHIEFADKDTYEFADTIYRLYKGGFLRAVSVGFTPRNWEGKTGENDTPRWGGNVFTEQELLELSACPVPANPDALESAKQKRIINAKEFRALKALNDLMLEEEHDKVEPEIKHEPKPVSQEALKDEMDYCISILNEVGISEITRGMALKLHETLSRLTGCDKPEDIKSGIQLLDSDGTVINLTNVPVADMTEPQPAESLSEQDKHMVAELIAQTIDRVIKNRSK